MKFSDCCFLYNVSAFRFLSLKTLPAVSLSQVTLARRRETRSLALVVLDGAHPVALDFQTVREVPWGESLSCWGVMIISPVTAMVAFLLLVVLTWMPFHFSS